ncbi:MAG: hypothetical protein ACI81V_001050 [Lentimonas sp.]|jgi:hypothetical protein
MDFNACNFKKINQFKAEARRWKPGEQGQDQAAVSKGKRTQPMKRKKKKKG